MDNKTKEAFAKMRSLMERMDNPMSAFQARLNESMYVNEATSKNRVRVGRDEIVELIEAADNEQNVTNRGLFATFTYVKPAEILKTKQNIDNDKLETALNNHADKSDTDWHKSLSAFKELENKRTNKTPISTIVTVTRYHIKWHSLENYDSDYSSYSTDLHNVRMKYNPDTIQSDGMLGDNHNQREKSDASKIGRINSSGKFARDFNMAKQYKKPSRTAYIVDETGNIVSEIPEEVMWSIHGKKSNSSYDTGEKSMRDALTPEVYEQYVNDKKELDAKFQAANFIWDSILCICFSVGGTSYYYINDALIAETAKKNGIYVNQSEMIKIAEEQLGESFDVIQGFAN